jgi:signal transduction histidine kinase
VEEVCEPFVEEAKTRGIRMVLALDPSLPQVTVDADGIHTCLLNLVTNAIEAFPPDSSGGQITVSSSDEGEAGVHLQVRDTGEGMSEELRQRVLENLFTTKGARGTGLGLAITQKIIHEHGGTIQVESEPDKGSCFTIILPEES